MTVVGFTYRLQNKISPSTIKNQHTIVGKIASIFFSTTNVLFCTLNFLFYTLIFSANIKVTQDQK